MEVAINKEKQGKIHLMNRKSLPSISEQDYQDSSDDIHARSASVQQVQLIYSSMRRKSKTI